VIIEIKLNKRVIAVNLYALRMIFIEEIIDENYQVRTGKVGLREQRFQSAKSRYSLCSIEYLG